MGLLNLTNLEDDKTLTANMLNERFGKIGSILNGNIEAENIKNGSITAAKLANDFLDKIYPVGSLYFNASNDQNPASLLGFGTWEAYSVGRFPVGYNAAETEFNAVGATGGEKVHVLTQGEMPSHGHGVNDPGHTHVVPGNVFTAPSTNTTTDNRNGGYQQISWGNQATHGAGTGISIQGAGGGAAHNNLPPYQAVYIWRRTA